MPPPSPPAHPRDKDTAQRHKRARHGSRSQSRSVERSSTPRRSPALHHAVPSPSLPPRHAASASSSRDTSLSLPSATHHHNNAPPHHQHHPLQQQCASATDRVVTYKSDAAGKKNKKKDKHKKARQEENKPTHHQGSSPSIEKGAQGASKSLTAEQQAAKHAAAQSLLSRLSEVELQFQLEQDRTQRTTLAPRDIANLILWSVPAPVPLIESPRIFFIKNKSHLRNVVVIYVNGWSYDELLCTGVGLPRASSSSPSLTTTTTATPSTPQNAFVKDQQSERGAAKDSNTSGGGGDGEHDALWDKQLCSAMLSPVREGRCWARPNRGSTCAGGVQYCPLFIPNTKNELEKDLWWRNDAPRRPGEKNSGGGTNNNNSNGRAERESLYMSPSSPTPAESHGVGSMFQRALQAHAKDTPQDKSNGGGDEQTKKVGEEGANNSSDLSGSAASPTTNTNTTFNVFRPYQHLWHDRGLLLQYALKLPTHATELTELGFILTPPPQLSAASSSSLESAEAQDNEEDVSVENTREKEESGACEAWAAFDAPKTTAPAPQPQQQPQQVSDASMPSTSAGESAAPHPRVFALDCEMVQVASGESALARATLVDVQSGSVVLDTLVKPQQRISDYLTRFSGIDKAMLDPVSTTLADCQAQMKALIDTESFVVGHSLENDFKACKFIPNCYVLDTAWLFPHPAGLPYKNALRFLAHKYLNRRIQQGAHDSAIDALVSAELAQLKLLHGPAFGVRPRVSVLGLITAAAGDAAEPASTPDTSEKNQQNSEEKNAAEGVGSSDGKANSTAAAVRKEPEVDVQVHLFDDAVTLTTLLPSAPKNNSNGGQNGSSMGSTNRSAAPAALPQSQVGRIDAVPVRHDEDAMRKAVRALQRRSQQLESGEEAQQQLRELQDGVQPSEPALKPSFGLYWVQLTENKVDVVLPGDNSSGAPAHSPPACEKKTFTTSADAVTSGKDSNEEGVPASTQKNLVPNEEKSATAPDHQPTPQQQHTAAQYRVVHDTNRRVLRIIEACPQETLVVVLTGRCSGESGGNHFSRAQGTCFAFIKDSTAAGPREDELARQPEEQHEVPATAEKKADLNVSNGGAAAKAPPTLRDTTPPACQQQ